MNIFIEYADTKFLLEDIETDDGCMEDIGKVYIYGTTKGGGHVQYIEMGVDAFWLIYDGDAKLSDIINEKIAKESPVNNDCYGSDPTGKKYGVSFV